MNAVKLLNLTVLELFVNDMTILTASMGTIPVEEAKDALSHVQWGWILTMSLAKCVLLDNIETNSCCL